MSWIKLHDFMFCSKSCWQFSFTHISWGGGRQNERKFFFKFRYSLSLTAAEKARPAWPPVIVKFQFCVLSGALISQHSPGSGSQRVHTSDSVWVFHWVDWGVASQSCGVWISKKASVPIGLALKLLSKCDIGQDYIKHTYTYIVHIVLDTQLDHTVPHFSRNFLVLLSRLVSANS